MGDLRDIENDFRRRLLLFPPAIRAEFLTILRMPTSEKASFIGSIYASGRLPEFSELLIDLEEDRYARTVVMGLLAEMERAL